ncbi:DUF2730 family protein [Martelella mediterranea]|uniref:Uncharacterized protein DUF2730 n=1 Tax=Martelella mediterranea TaxID=293089 RepID=A0A4R3NU87_9HYPH|nr:DUF2730 family protein [Martelella mediterranea]TCT41165.1 uncharacterized protein DUF2730 [Martelella mediterranea]
MEPRDLQLWLSIAATLLSIGAVIYAVITAKAKGNSVKLDKLEGKVEDHGQRIQSLEDEMEHLPDKESQHRIEVGLVELNGRMDVLSESLKPIHANNQLLHDLLQKQVTK